MIVYFEGADGVGKSTQLAAMRREFGEVGWAGCGAEFGGGAIFTAEPGATALGAKLRGILLGESGGENLGESGANSNLDGDNSDGGGNCGENLGAVEIKSPRAEALLFLADRAEHFDRVLKFGVKSRGKSGAKSGADLCGAGGRDARLDAESSATNSNLDGDNSHGGGNLRGECCGGGKNSGVPQNHGERLIFSDRGFVSGIAYALANGGDFDELLALNRFALNGYLGDKFVLLLGDERLFASRLKTRANADKIERRGFSYLLKVQGEMLRVLRAINADFIALDASEPAEQLTARIIEFIKH